MPYPKHSFDFLKTFIAAGLGLVVLAGCSTAPPKIEDNKEAMETATALRGYFDKVHGDYTALSAPDKEAYVKLVGGDQAKADKLWSQMKFGPGGAPVGGAPAGNGTSSPAVPPAPGG